MTARNAVVVAFALAAGALVLNRWWVRPRAALVKAIFESGPAVTPGSAYEAAAAAVDVIPDVVVSAPAVPPAALDLYRPKRPLDSPLPLILWIHGGGFLSGSKTQVRPYATMLAAEGYIVATLDYALAPRHRYPTAILQANAAAAYLAHHAADYGADPTRIFFGGDSAGAQLAGQLAALQTEPTLAAALSATASVSPPHLRGVILFCGFYDMRTVGDSGFPGFQTMLWSYTGHRDWATYPRIDELSTTAHLTPRYPPVFLSVGDADPFETQAIELQAALEQAGVASTTLLWHRSGRRLPHEYQFDFRRPEAEQAFAATLRFLRESS